MFKLSKLIFLLLMLIGFVAYAGKPNPAKYNDKIVKKQHKVVEGFKEFFKTFESGTKQKMHDERESLLKLVDKSIAEISAMEAIDGDSQLKDGALTLLKFYKKSLEEHYPKMIELIANRDRSKDDHAKLESYRTDLINEEKIHDDKFEEIQIAFAKKHKLDLR